MGLVLCVVDQVCMNGDNMVGTCMATSAFLKRSSFLQTAENDDVPSHPPPPYKPVASESGECLCWPLVVTTSSYIKLTSSN